MRFCGESDTRERQILSITLFISLSLEKSLRKTPGFGAGPKVLVGHKLRHVADKSSRLVLDNF